MTRTTYVQPGTLKLDTVQEQSLIPDAIKPQQPSSDFRSVDDLLKARVLTIPDAPVVGYPVVEGGRAKYVYYTPKQLDLFTNGAIATLMRNGLPPNIHEESKVVAILAPSNLDYVVTLFALVRMRYSVLLLSNRLATEAYVNLLEKTDCHHVLGSDPTTKLVNGILQKRQISALRVPNMVEYSTGTHKPPFVPTKEIDANAISFIIHSSGSTGLPKPIFQTHKACVSNYSNGNGFRAFLTLPLFHNHGISTFFRAFYKGTPVALYNAQLPLTSSNLIEALEIVRPESFHGVPYALKLLSESEEGIALLAQCKLVLFGGSSCPDDLGDKLVNSGVYLVSHYGATEMGQLMTSFRPVEDKAWNYVRPSAETEPYLHFAPREDETFECVVLDGWRSKVASNSDDPPKSFHTSDLFVAHPTISNAWKYIARNDDRVTLVNGEKVLPVPIEHKIRQNKLVKEVLVVGVGKALPGLLVIPSESATFATKQEYVAQIWPSIAVANSGAEGFSQICEELVEVLDKDVDYPSTDKGTIIRAASYRNFAPVIDSMYEQFEGTSQSTGSPKLALSIPDLVTFLLQTLESKTKVENISADTDFYDAGVDSLQAIAVWASLKKKLDLGSGNLSQNAIFEYSNVAKLARHLFALRTGEVIELEDEIGAMKELIAKYAKFEAHVPRVQEVILLTGTTGSLGAHILAKLLPLDSVRRVYCLVRASSESVALDRVLATLHTKKLLPSKNISKIVALPFDLGKKDLGLPQYIISDLRSSLTKVIHSAWAVNFNIGVRSFEQQHIKGVHHLIDLCLSVSAPKPAQFYFCSSISAAAGTPLPAVIDESPLAELDQAQNMGYARSKLVAEKIIQAAAESTGMVAKVLRVGQIVGDTRNGIWNTTEAIPLMIQSAVTMGCLPALDETPNWMPVDSVADTILDLSGLSTTTASTTATNLETESQLHDPSIVYHVQNPLTFHWTHDLLPALQNAGLDFAIVPQREWVRRLRESEPDPARNPTRKLLDFYADKYDNERPGRKGLVFRTEVTERASPCMRGGVDVIGSGLVGKIVREWLKAWGADGADVA